MKHLEDEAAVFLEAFSPEAADLGHGRERGRRASRQLEGHLVGEEHVGWDAFRPRHVAAEDEEAVVAGAGELVGGGERFAEGELFRGRRVGLGPGFGYGARVGGGR